LVKQLIIDGTSQKVQEYVDGVLAGEIVTSVLVRNAVARHVSDLEKQSSQGFPFYFDERLAAKVCNFFPLMLRHSIGEFAGFPFELEPWQAFGVWCLFGWKRDVDNSRRFRKCYWSMARKNGKSSFAAGLAHYLAMADVDPATGKPEAVGQILLTATKKEQAKVVYSEADRMRLQSPTLKEKTDVRYETITYKHNGSYIRMVSSDKPFDGLNPHCVVMDELHAWGEHHRRFYDTMVTGSASRTQPLHLIITTAGDDKSYLWLDEYKYAKDVVLGNISDETLFALSFELDEKDDPGDESCWIKANPNLNVSVKLDYLQQRWAEDKSTGLGINRFTRYHGNRVVSSTEKAFDLDLWDKCDGQLSDWKKADVVGAGVDLGGRDDLAAYALCARFKIGEKDDKPIYRYEVTVKAFIADDTTRDLARQPFSNWIHTGYINRIKYPIPDLIESLIEDCNKHEISTIAYDPYNGQQMGEVLTREGIIAARMPQNQANFNEAIRDFQQLLTDGRLAHAGNPLLRWCANNAIIARDRQDRWMFDKRESVDKIDPLVACVMAYRIASLAPERATGSLYL
jgi:phage terminase large subunit-like protein